MGSDLNERSSPPRVCHSDMTRLRRVGWSATEAPHCLSLYVSDINSLFLSLSSMPSSLGLLPSPVISYFLTFITDFFSSAAASSLKRRVAFRQEGREAP